MKFIGKKNRIVWDAGADKPLCSFGSDGKFETDDIKTIMKLKLQGYEVEKEMTKAELIDYCRDNEITGYSNLKVDELRELVKE